MVKKFVNCGRCGVSFLVHDDSTICVKCATMPPSKSAGTPPADHVPFVPMTPRIVWEGMGRVSGLDRQFRAVLVEKEPKKFEVLFEHTIDKDAMGVSIWHSSGTTPPHQFVKDAAMMMDTASGPNRTGVKA